MLATTNEAPTAPSVIEHVSEAIEPPPLTEQLVSLVEKPEPVICTVEPAEVEVGVRVMDNVPPFTVNVSEPESPVELPVAVIV